MVKGLQFIVDYEPPTTNNNIKIMTEEIDFILESTEESMEGSIAHF